MKYSILIVDDEKEFGNSFSQILVTKGYNAFFTTDPLTVNSIMHNQDIDLIIMDIRMPKLGGIDLLKIVKKDRREIPIIMVTGYPSVDSAVQSMRYGALNVYVKPLKIPEIINEIEQVMRSHRKEANTYSPGNDFNIITNNPEMERRIENLKKAAPTDAPVILTGESGTGKELAANTLHHFSNRGEKPFVKVNCAAIPDTLLESELFGHRKGAFTDATYQRVGKFELAKGGTIFLDEISDMSLKTQAKILRVLQEKEFERLGGSEILKADTRVIAATNKNIQELIEEGTFREDLYYRLSVITIDLLPLRKRREDVMLLAEYFLNLFNRIYEKEIRGFTDEVRNIFLKHSWPGNVRELKNCVERAVIFCEGSTICTSDLSSQYRDISVEMYGNDFQTLYSSLSREMISEALKKCDGSKQKAADLLKVHRKTLYNKMKKLGMG